LTLAELGPCYISWHIGLAADDVAAADNDDTMMLMLINSFVKISITITGYL